MEGSGVPPALPRALDVQRFAGAREQEIRALCSALQEGPLGDKFGVAALPRHLRRRAGSHKPFHGHRFRPNLKLQGKRRKIETATEEQEADEAVAGEAAAGAGAGGDGACVPEGEPAELAGTSAAVRPFTNRRMRRQPAALAEQHRRSAAWTEASLTASAAAMSSAETAGGGSNGSSTSLRRLETHVWHAKRLAMEERYGWLLPTGAAGQGRGSRSFAHVARTSCIMHDASYLCPLLLRGPWCDVRYLLRRLLAPEDYAALEADWEEYSSSVSSSSSGGSSSITAGWEEEEDVMLYHPGRYPAGAICPAGLLLAPCSEHPADGSSGSGSGDGNAGSAAQPMQIDAGAAEGPAPAAAAAAPAGEASAAGSAGVQACLWVHPAAAAEAHAALRLAAQQQPGAGAAAIDSCHTTTSSSCVSIAVLDLRRLELRGGTADAALAVALAGATAGGVQQQQQQEQRQQGEQKRGHQQQQQQQQPQQEQEGPRAQGAEAPGANPLQPRLPLPRRLAGMLHGEAVQLLLPDPRLRKPVALGSASGSLLGGGADSAAGGAAAAAAIGAAAASLQGGPAQEGAQPEQHPGEQQPGVQQPGVQQLEEQGVDLLRLLRAPLPLSEAELSSQRQQLRRRMLQLDPAAAGAAAGAQERGDGSGGAQQGQQAGQQAGQLAKGLLLQGRQRGYCPAVLVRHNPQEDGGIPGWSLILPSGWVPPLWLAAAYAGCKPAGQREWRWLAALQQRSCFPWDHPDTAGYAALMQQQQALRAAAAAKRPKGKRMLAGPAAPPAWQQLLLTAGQQAGTGAGAGDAPAPEADEQQPAAQGGQQQDRMEVDAPAAPVAQTAAAAAAAGVVAAAAAGLAAVEAEAQIAEASPLPPAPSSTPASGIFVARSYAAMAAALQSSNTSSTGSHSAVQGSEAPMQGSRPVAAALQDGRLMWRPKQQAGAGSAADSAAPAGNAPTAAVAASLAGSVPGRGLCLVEAWVRPIKSGMPAEGAAVCLVAGWEAAQHCRAQLSVLSARQLRRRQRALEEGQAALAEAGGDPADATIDALCQRFAGGSGSFLGGRAGGSSGGEAEVGEGQVQVIGFVLSEAPRGAPRRCATLAAVGAAAAWRLRSLQHWAPAQGGGGGGILAFARNPGSAALFPVRLHLVLEQASG